KKKNIVLERVLVEDYAAEGKSLARSDGKVIFIENAVPGDVVDVRLNKNKRDWAEGSALHFHSYSADRVQPFCSHFGVCGGCQWQMLPYEKQLQYKQRQVSDNLQRIGKIDLPEIMPIMGPAETKYYSNKIEYTFGTKEFTKEKPSKTNQNDHQHFHEPAPNLNNQGKIAGYHAKGFFDKIVDIETCYLQAEPTNRIRLAVKKFAIENDYSFYDMRQHTGFTRNMQIRLCTTGELMVNIVFAQDDKEKITAILNYIRTEVPSITTLLYTINTKKNDSLHDLEPITYFGKGFVIERMEDFQFKIGPKSFFQTNTKQGEKLYNVARDFAELTGNEVVYDLY